eukprot:1151097-Pelagomonas_calceolata.AAC.7
MRFALVFADVVRMLKDKCPACDPSSVPNSGPAPVLARFEDFKVGQSAELFRQLQHQGLSSVAQASAFVTCFKLVSGSAP